MQAALDLSPYAGARCGVMGLGRSGRAAAAALARAGATVLAWDDDAEARAALGGNVAAVAPLTAAAVTTLDLLVWSPGIPHTHPRPHPVADAAREAGVRMICDIQLLAEAAAPTPLVGVTGTNGKSTTTALIGHLLSEVGVPCAIGGNIGAAALSLPRQPVDGVYVIELSSYQLELIDRARFKVAVLLNVTPDHLDRHGGMEGYVAAKRRLFARMGEEDVAVICTDDDWTRGIADELVHQGRHVIRVGTRDATDCVFYVDANGLLHDRADDASPEPVDLRAHKGLPGRHNWQNAVGAYAAVRMLQVAPEAAAAGLASFAGLAHRLQTVGEIGGVRFVNDSKATNGDAASHALAAFDDIYWIAGGVPKAGGIESLRPWFERIARAYLIGDAAEQFAETLAGAVPAEQCGTLDRAVGRAFADARADGRQHPVVLLSPACASFDQFTDFEARGATFAAAVAALADREGGQ